MPAAPYRTFPNQPVSSFATAWRGAKDCQRTEINQTAFPCLRLGLPHGDDSFQLKVLPADPACSTAGDCTTVGSGLSAPGGVAVDGGGGIYIADTSNSRVLEENVVTPPSLTSASTPVNLTSSKWISTTSISFFPPLLLESTKWALG